MEHFRALFMRYLSYIPTWKRKEYMELVNEVIKLIDKGGKK